MGCGERFHNLVLEPDLAEWDAQGLTVPPLGAEKLGCACGDGICPWTQASSLGCLASSVPRHLVRHRQLATTPIFLQEALGTVPNDTPVYSSCRIS